MHRQSFLGRFPRSPAGLSALGLLLLISLVGFFVILLLRLVPHYIDFRKIDSVMDGLAAREIKLLSKSEIREILTRRYKINNIRDLKVEDIVEIERKNDEAVIEVAYEIREPILYNIDVVLSFGQTYSYR